MGMAGAVRVQFVVDTAGHVERGSIHVLDATHVLFAWMVQQTLQKSRWTPAVRGRTTVRQLVSRHAAFVITGRVETCHQSHDVTGCEVSYTGDTMWSEP